MKRVFWLALGLGAGSTVAVLASRWMKRQRQRIVPANLGPQAGEALRDLARLLGEAVAEFRKGMSDKEAEVRGAMPRP